MSSQVLVPPLEAEDALGGPAPLLLRLPPSQAQDDTWLLDLSAQNRDLRIERNALGELVILPPVAIEGSSCNSDLNAQLWLWARRDATGIATDSSAGFRLADSSVLSPDGAWIERGRYRAAREGKPTGFLPARPDFLFELRSDSDRLGVLRRKMAAYLANGARLAWLIDPVRREVSVYRPGQEVEVLHQPESVSADPVLPGFTMDLRRVWEP